MLARGGNAVDAAVATAAALAVVEPFGSGLGGGAFLLAYLAETDTVVALDCRETAPASATPSLFVDATRGEPFDRDLVASSGLSVGAPGMARCWEEALGRWGRLPLAEVLAPAIALARDGFATTRYFAAQSAAHADRLRRHPESARLFLPNG